MDLHNSYTGKPRVAYSSMETALKVRTLRRLDLIAYRCPVCKKFHLGSRNLIPDLKEQGIYDVR